MDGRNGRKFEWVQTAPLPHLTSFSMWFLLLDTFTKNQSHHGMVCVGRGLLTKRWLLEGLCLIVQPALSSILTILALSPYPTKFWEYLCRDARNSQLGAKRVPAVLAPCRLHLWAGTWLP